MATRQAFQFNLVVVFQYYILMSNYISPVFSFSVKNLLKNFGRSYHSMVSLGTKILLFGGFPTGGLENDEIGDEVYELDCHTCDWRMLNKTLGNEERWSMVAFSVPSNWSLC